MRILFLNPPFKGRFSRTSRSPAVAKGGTFYYPIWLAYAAGESERAGHDVHLFDAPATGAGEEELLAFLNDWEPGLVVIDTSTPSIYNDAEVAARIKQRYSGVMMLLVGTHPSSLPEETIAINDAIDAVAVGEYDATIRDLADSLDRGALPDAVAGLVLRRGDGTVRTPERALITDLDAIPFVSKVYDKHLEIPNYFFAASNYPMVQIITGRGCPHRCFFCVYPQVFHSHRYRTRSTENVVDEFEFIQKHLPQVREVGLEDDCFTASPIRVRKICQGLIDRKIKLKWHCNVRGDVKPDLLKLMKKAGCRLVIVGFESGDQAVLDGMKKGIKVEKYLQFVQDVKKADLMIHGCMMVGNPGDTRETLERSYQFAVGINCDSMQFYPVYLYPGTEAFWWAVENGYLKTNDYTQWLTPDGTHNCVYDTPELSAKEMMALCNHYLKKYHLRPRYILMKLLQSIRHPSEGYRTALAAISFFSKLFKGQIGGVRHD